MFIFTARVRWGRLIAGAVAAAGICLLVAGFFFFGDGAVAALGVVRGISTPEDRVAYLEGLGWTVKSEPLSVEELLIPKTFDESYADYLALQTEQGFDLSKYCGKRLRRYTYEITNYPTGEEGVQVSILVFRNRIVGGDVLSTQQDGFLHGLAVPQG
ncbi:MAG: DUF4830 domain-containing protein [Oscillospiraceae bacterium]